jgi:phage-related protein
LTPGRNDPTIEESDRVTPAAGWTVEFYVEDNGTIPVQEFLRILDDRAQARLGRAIEELQRVNVQAREPLVKKIKDKLWELRAETGGNAYRILYFTMTGKKIVLLHGFQKKTQKTPKGDIKIAEQRMKRRLAREEDRP